MSVRDKNLYIPGNAGLQSGDASAVAKAVASAQSTSDAQGVASALAQAYSQGGLQDTYHEHPCTQDLRATELFPV